MRVCPECGRESAEERCPDDGRITLDRGLLQDSDPWIGRVIADKYSVEARIGRGGMGAVYRARHTDTGGLVAVKVLHASVRGDAQAIKRFHLEAQNAAGLNHSHTIRVTDFGVEGETPYLVMEFLHGQPLSAVMKQNGALPWQRAVRIISGVLKSLWEAHEHERRIVHRDIKPQNIFLSDQQGSQDFVKVLDFGISRSLESQGANTVGPIGTPHYMAPEQWRGVEVDGRADLYSCGCMLYELLAGRAPFLVDNNMPPTQRMATLAQKHLNEAAPRLGGDSEHVLPPDLIELVHDLLSKEPELRPQTAAAVLARLETLGDSEHADSTLPYVAPAAGRLVVESAADSEAGDTPEFFDDTIATGGVEVATATDAATTSDGPPRRKGWLIGVFVALLIVAGAAALFFASGGTPDPARLAEVIRDAAASKQERGQAVQQLLANSAAMGQAPALGGALLAGAVLNGRSLKSADLKRADLAESDLRKSDLSGADLRDAKLVGANLRGAILRRADLRGADLRGCRLDGADLRDSKLHGANLSRCQLGGARLNGAHFSTATRWPQGFDPAAAGARAEL